MKNKSFEERAKEARKIIKLRFAGSKSLTNDNDWAELIALHTVGWGGLERQINASQIKKVKRATNILEKLIDETDTSPWLRTELKLRVADLNQISKTPKLHGKQNTSLHTYKVSLVRLCRNIWISYYAAEPSLSHHDTNKFAVFVADVIFLVFGHDFSVRSALEAYVISENTD